jgi:hypothetical protein
MLKFIYKGHLLQGCHNGRFWVKMNVRTSILSVYPFSSSGHPCLPVFNSQTQFYLQTGFSVSVRGKIPSTRTCACIRANEGPAGANAGLVCSDGGCVRTDEEKK